jgi:hypothetical protein
MIFLGGNPGGAGSLAFFLDFGLLQKADNRQAAQPSPAQPSSNKLYNYVIISLAD